MNPYIRHLITAWQANHDIQFVLDAYACAMYIVSYISKSQRGMSTLLYNAAKEAKKGDTSLKEQVRHIGNKFLNATEISAQEAVYLTLQLPVARCSREVIFINTSPPEERTFLLKSTDKLQQLKKSSTDIEESNIIKRYSQRPGALKNWCLADYASKLNITYPAQYEPDEFAENLDDDIKDAENHDDDSSTASKIENINIVLKNGVTIKQRQNP